MKGICCWAIALLAVGAAASSFIVTSICVSDQNRAEAPAHILGAGDPIAVITPVPDYVSNGSWINLDGSESHDTDGGIITEFLWEIIFGESVTLLYAENQTYMFKELGLYKVTLTVTDNTSKTGQAFTALVSILDSDYDAMPDWWELAHFDGSLAQTPEGDFDSDGYTNLEEYAKGTDPSVFDPQPPLPPKPTLIETLKDNWMILAVVAAVVVAAVLAAWPFLRKKRKRREKKQIAAAIEIEKALEQEGK